MKSGCSVSKPTKSGFPLIKLKNAFTLVNNFLTFNHKLYDNHL